LIIARDTSKRGARIHSYGFYDHSLSFLFFISHCYQTNCSRERTVWKICPSHPWKITSRRCEPDKATYIWALVSWGVNLISFRFNNVLWIAHLL